MYFIYLVFLVSCYSYHACVMPTCFRAETMISEEIESVQTEADEIESGWSQSIWPLAMQLRYSCVFRIFVEPFAVREVDDQGCL